MMFYPSFTFANEGYSFKDRNKDSAWAQKMYRNAANHFNKQQFDSVNVYLGKILSKEHINNKLHVKTLVLMGLTFSRSNMNDKAIDCFSEALEINKTKDKLLESQIYGNLGEVYFYLGEYKKAIQYFENDLAIKETIANCDLQITLSNIGAAYIHLQKPKVALPYIQKAFQSAQMSKDTLGQSICINNLATIYRDLKNYSKAFYYYSRALELVSEFDSEEEKMILYNLYQLSEMNNDNANALKFLKMYTSLNEELTKQKNAEFIVETQEKYQTEKRLKELAEIKIEVQKKEAKNSQFIFRSIIISILVLLLFSFVLIWYRWKLTKQKNQAKLQIIHATMQGEENQRVKIAQELHDDLGGLLGISRMLFTTVRNQSNQNDVDIFNKIDDLLLQANSKTRLISHELFSPILKQYGLAAALEDYVKTYQLANPNLEITFNSITTRFPEKIELNLFRITQELISNTIKHANASKIQLTMSGSKDHVNYQYQDNGIGYDNRIIKKGVGLASIEARVALLKGKVSYASDKSGTGVIIVIPV
jgi:signal transduction histidine kinase